MSTPRPPTNTFEPLASVPVIILIASMSAVLMLGVCSLIACHCYIVLSVFRRMAPPSPTVITIHNPDTPPSEGAPDDTLCYVCLDADADTMLLGCGHRGLCSACALRLWRMDRRCPLCRVGLSGLVFLRGFHGEVGQTQSSRTAEA